MLKAKQDLSVSVQFDNLDPLIPYITSYEDPKNPSIDLNKLDYILKDYNYHKDERKSIKKALSLYKNQKGVLTVDSFRAFFDIPQKEEIGDFKENIVTSEDLGILFDMISSVDGKRTEEIDLKKMKEFTKILEIDIINDDRTLSLMYKLARNPETGKLMKEDLIKMAKYFEEKKIYS